MAKIVPPPGGATSGGVVLTNSTLEPTGTVASSFKRATTPPTNNGALGWIAGASNGLATAVELAAGVPLTTIHFMSGSTSANTPTHRWVALHDFTTGNLIVQSVDAGSAAWGANVEKVMDLTAPYTPTVTGPIWVVLFMNATAFPSLLAAAPNANAMNVAPVLEAIPANYMTLTGATAPSNLGTIGSGVGSRPWIWIT